MPKVSATDNNDIIYIADLGESPFVYINGKDEPVYRYAVWNDSKTRIIDYSDDLEFLRDKYGRDKQIRVLTYKPFMDKKES
ncbi:hypothetical protein [Oxalobacter formigenes]|jgi:hypothetical protein|uniref:Uncharacterized protein n=1 Tax=Oxalobacter formigenes OXCC13 TaxID=556269 RepID=C3X972_OXAFO|nr:hypothetical protein [Oxalobacter formigenes]ARQ78316.1 hypothetical protein BRW84_06625 [Oxalobacter formigenes OXCC13]EEO29748.1 hypothetical protein OFBG_00776 [Oxalobacter formigenes OXCC13]WAW00694.1 hypothetical protein NB644_07000 [Oxalobacter formigenes]WAW03026.1 hypothetical protein NB642_07790 [Oxalobacter formigenes]WAW07074.1 hypothetical protein NB638_05890 [Oxalobacter formigenes]